MQSMDGERFVALFINGNKDVTSTVRYLYETKFSMDFVLAMYYGI